MPSDLSSLTRRTLLAAGASLPFALRGLAQAPAPRWLLLGTDKGKGIYRASWNPQTGAVGRPELAVESFRPSFFAMDAAARTLYTADEGSDATATVSAFRIEPSTAGVRLLNRVAAGGDGPCFVAVDTPARAVFCADYSGGAFLANGIAADGSLVQNDPTRRVYKPPFAHTGPVPDRQDAAHLHCSVVSPDGRFVVVCDLGGDRLLLFPIHAAERGTQALVGDPITVAARPGSGPRHVAFHPNRRWMYCIHELDCTVELFDWKTGAMPLVRRDGTAVGALPPGTALAGNTCSELALDARGEFLYAATRGIDLLTVFRIDGGNGTLTAVQHLPCGGRQPRFITLDPSGRWLLSCHQEGSSVAVFARDAKTGLLTKAQEPVAAESPMCLVFV